MKTAWVNLFLSTVLKDYQIEKIIDTNNTGKKENFTLFVININGCVVLSFLNVQSITLSYLFMQYLL